MLCTAWDKRRFGREEDEASSTAAACMDRGDAVQQGAGGEDAKSKPANCRLKEEERGKIKKKKRLGRNWKGMCLPLTSQLCVGCRQMPHILCITTRQLFVALDPCNREIRFCLCIRSSCKGAKRS